MRAITYANYGDLSVLRPTELPLPKVGPGEVLVRTRAAGVNPVDWKIMSGGLDGLMDTFFPVIPGWDVAGVVERVGIDTPEFSPGDEVYAYARKDVVHAGTFAEYVTVPVRALARKPQKLSFVEAAALPLAGLTAYQSLTRLGVSAGDTVLIHNGSGGVGSAAVQIAAAWGATVIATASPANHQRLESLGADHVVAYGAGLVDAVRAIAPAGVDVSLDLVGGVEDQTLSLLTSAGRHGSIADDAVLQHGGQWLWVRPSAEDLGALAELVDAGKLKVDVAATYPLADVADAFATSQGGHVAGKLVITVG